MQIQNDAFARSSPRKATRFCNERPSRSTDHLRRAPSPTESIRSRPCGRLEPRGRLVNRLWSRTKHPMKAYVALLRAVNVGGTGKLPMSTLKQMCEEVRLKQVRTHIASGNIVLRVMQRRQKSSWRLRDDCTHMQESRLAC